MYFCTSKVVGICTVVLVKEVKAAFFGGGRTQTASGAVPALAAEAVSSVVN